MSCQTYDVADQRTGHLATVNLWRHHVKRDTARGLTGRLSWETLNPASRAGMRKAFHGFILAEFVAHTGHSHAEMKAWLTWKFCPDQIDAAGNLVGEFEKSTEAMTDEQFSVFLTQVEAFGAWLGLIFPPRPMATEQES